MTSSGEIQCYWSDLLFLIIYKLQLTQNAFDPSGHNTCTRDGLNLFNLLNKLRFEPQFFVSCNYNFGTVLLKNTMKTSN